MLRIFIQILGFASLGAGFLSGVVDGTRSIAAGAPEWSSMGSAASWLLPRQMAGLEKAVVSAIHPLLWDPVLVTILKLPATIALLGLGFIFLVAGIRKESPIKAP